MPAIPKLTIYTNDGTTVLGSINLLNVGQDGYMVYVNDSGISPTERAVDGYIYDGPGKWLGVSKSPNTTNAEYGPGTTLTTKTSLKVYAVIKNTVNIDLSTLSGYSSIISGTHNIQVKAKADGYEDSDLSDSVSYTGSMPAKGDILTIESKQYRVLKINGTIAEALAMYDATDLQEFDTSEDSNVYVNSSLDVYLSQTFYNSLSTSMQNAIVAKTFQQDSWYNGSKSDALAKYNGTYFAIENYALSLMSTTFGSSISRKCYVLSCQDVIDYLEVTTSMEFANTTLTSENIWRMFWNQTTSPESACLWLRSAKYDYSSSSFYVNSDDGSLDSYTVDNANAVRPAFQIDLSKVEYTKQ